MKILLKYPTRERPEEFIENIKRWESMLSDENEYQWLIALDEDDRSMDDVIEHEDFFTQPYNSFRRNHDGKIDACNSGVNDYIDDFDMVWLVSDDMKPMVQDFDLIIEREMQTHYPDMDGCLHINDGLQGIRLCTFSCMGAKYYKRFGYMYHPQYKSTHCDDEFTQIAWANRRMLWIPEVLVKHEWVGLQQNPDELHKKNHAMMNTIDAQTYQKRANAGFPKNNVD